MKEQESWIQTLKKKTLEIKVNTICHTQVKTKIVSEISNVWNIICGIF